MNITGSVCPVCPDTKMIIETLHQQQRVGDDDTKTMCVLMVVYPSSSGQDVQFHGISGPKVWCQRAVNALQDSYVDRTVPPDVTSTYHKALTSWFLTGMYKVSFSFESNTC